jgi:hypothetical protein
MPAKPGRTNHRLVLIIGFSYLKPFPAASGLKPPFLALSTQKTVAKLQTPYMIPLLAIFPFLWLR